MINFVEAQYNEQIIDYAGNPLIEALPPIQSFNNVIQLLSVRPEFNESEREHSSDLRFHYIQRVFHYVNPFIAHLRLERKLSAVIKQSYIHRNPLEKEHVNYMNNSYNLLMQGKLPEQNKININRRVQGFSIIGISGSGKTTAVDSILKIYPQVIRHTNYRGKKLLLTQIPWLKIECPSNGSTKGLCINFFRVLDDLLQTDYSLKHQNRTQDIMLSQMGHLSRLHNVGVLVIDEIQHLSMQKSGGADRMLNFFVTMVNSIGIPVVLIGTNKAFELLNKEFRQARRGNGQGISIWKRMDKGDEWNALMKDLFKYQWTRKPVELNEEMNEIFYDESQGVLDLAIKLFVLSQMEAIINRTEQITPELIRKSGKVHLHSLQPMIRALRENDSTALEKYEDLKVDFNEIGTDLREELITSDFIEYNKQKNKDILKEIKKVLTQKLTAEINDLKVVKKAVDRVTEKLNVDKYNIDELYKSAKVFAENEIVNNKQKNKKSKKEIHYNSNDLRGFKDKALKNKQSVYSILKENNIIVDLYGSFPEKERI